MDIVNTFKMETEFAETQKFNKWWHYLIAGLPAVFITLIIVCTMLLGSNKQSNTSIQYFVMAMPIVFTVFTFIWFLNLKLKTFIDREGISTTFYGIPFCKRNVLWSEILSVSVVQYSPLSDYGGWGVRYGLSAKGWCYNVSGQTGIKINYKNNKSFMIGTQKAGEAEVIIKKYFKP